MRSTPTGLAAPERVLFVGDTAETDIEGAKRFGMQAAWVRRGRDYPAGLRAAGPRHRPGDGSAEHFGALE